MTNSMKQYFTDEWILTPSSNYSRKYTSLGYSVGYQRKVNEYSLGLTLGLVTRSVNEGNEYDYVSGSNYSVKETFEYRQKHYVSSINLTKTEEFDKLNIGLKFEIPFVFYGKGTNNYYKRVNSDNPSDYILEEKQSISSGYSTGFGLGLIVNYLITDNFFVGIDISEYLMFVNFTKPTFGNYSETYPLGDYSNVNSDYESTNKYQQTGFSRVVPYFKLGYKF